MDEIVVDLMRSACGIECAEAAKDAPDLLFLRYWFEARGELPPEC